MTPIPTNPAIQRKTPEMKKARMINITPVARRNIPSPLPTFFTFTASSSSFDSSAIDENPHSYFRSGVLNLFPDHSPTH
jgi:hypothetical protein